MDTVRELGETILVLARNRNVASASYSKEPSLLVVIDAHSLFRGVLVYLVETVIANDLRAQLLTALAQGLRPIRGPCGAH